MPAWIVVVLRDHELAQKTAERLTGEGYDAIALTNSMEALGVLESARQVELLITSAHFPGRQPNGLSLALMIRLRRPGLKVIFANGPDMKPHVGREGLFVPTPTTPEAIAELAIKLMRAT